MQVFETCCAVLGCCVALRASVWCLRWPVLNAIVIHVQKDLTHQVSDLTALRHTEKPHLIYVKTAFDLRCVEIALICLLG